MKHIKSEKLYTVITSLLILLLITNISVFALDETSNEIQSQNTINNPTTPPKPQIFHPSMQDINIQKPISAPIHPPVFKEKSKKIKTKSPVGETVSSTKTNKKKKIAKQKTNKESNIAPQPRLTSVKPETKPSEIIKTTTMSGAGGGYGTGNPSPGNRYATAPKSSFSVPVAHTSKCKPPLWVDTENKTGSKVYIDMNNQYYFDLGHVYTVKYVDPRTGNTNYVQIKLKLRGKEAAIVSVTSEYKHTYVLPVIIKDYINMTQDKALYNSTRMVLENTNKPNCPKNICKYKK